jgi:hypothetical protein
MQSNDPSLMVYSETRNEFTKQLCQFIVPAILRFTIELLDKARELTKTEPKKLLFQFQILLNDIPDWNKDKCFQEINKIKQTSNCEYLDDLITAVFIAYTKILSSINVNSNNKNIQVRVPDLDHFLYKVLIEVGKLYWKSTYLFRDDVPNIEKQKNYKQIEELIQEGIQHAIRLMIPVKSILKNCISQSDIHDNNESDEIATASDETATASDETATASDETATASDEIATASDETATASDETATASDEIPVVSNNIIIENDLLIPIIPSHDEDHNSITHEPNEDNTPPTILNIDNQTNESKVKFADYSSVFNEDDSRMMEFNEDEMDDEYCVSKLHILDEPDEPISVFDELNDLSKSPVQELLSDNDFNL